MTDTVEPMGALEVLAGPNPRQDAAVAAVTKNGTLACASVHAGTLDACADDWLSSSFR